MSWSTVQENRKSFIVRHMIVRRLEGSISGSLSPIERWSDDNYAAQPLELIWGNSPQSHHMATRLHGFEASDVHVDVCRGHVIILLSRDYAATSSGQREYYREIPIPPDAKPDRALVEVTDDILMVTLYKRQASLFKRLVSAVNRLEPANRPNQRQQDALSGR